MHQNFIIPYLYEVQHVSGDTPPIIRSLNLHWQPLGFYTWKVFGRVVGGRVVVGHVFGERCQAHMKIILVKSASIFSTENELMNAGYLVNLSIQAGIEGDKIIIYPSSTFAVHRTRCCWRFHVTYKNKLKILLR